MSLAKEVAIDERWMSAQDFEAIEFGLVAAGNSPEFSSAMMGVQFRRSYRFQVPKQGTLTRMLDVLKGPLGTSEEVGGFRVIGNKGMVGKTYTRNILGLITKNATTNSSFRQAVEAGRLFQQFEQEAINLGADSISITGNTVENIGFGNPSAMNLLGRRYGYQVHFINKDTVHLWKALRKP
jgi:hypothetical protein